MQGREAFKEVSIKTPSMFLDVQLDDRSLDSGNTGRRARFFGLFGFGGFLVGGGDWG